MLKQQKGITLVALVITIVVLVIIAGVVITVSLSNQGIFQQATNARDFYNEQAAKEKEELTNIEQKLTEEITKAKTMSNPA